MDQGVATLIAERAIERQLHNYCRAMDRCDLALGKAVFHPDTQVDYGPMYQGPADGFVEFTIRSHAAARNHLHRISNIIIDVADERAGSETYVDARFRFTIDGADIAMFTRGRYLDRWERRDGRWAISHRTYIHEMDGQAPAGSERYAHGGSPDPSDPSYDVLAGR